MPIIYLQFRIRGYPCKTNKVSNTAFRGFGGPQGMLVIERVMEEIARYLKKDAYEVRKKNFYRGKNQTAPYGLKVFDNIIPELCAKLAKNAKYQERRKKIIKFNEKSKVIKKGLALTPVKFGISFSVTFLNQAGALINVYRDGTVSINHGGTEMGQGLYIKVAQVVASSLGISLDKVSCDTTTTAKVPNTSATAASVGADINGKAALNACVQIKNRLAKLASDLTGDDPTKVKFNNNKVILGKRQWKFEELVQAAYYSQIQLSATGYYKTPKVKVDPISRKGRPFFYYAYGACVSEVAIDTLTGEYKLLQVDILHDVGQSINPAIDQGQIEGGYAQGYGWLTSEELLWDKAGKPLIIGPATYKIPAASDMPEKFKVNLWPQINSEDTIYRSKAVGEPPLMLAISAFAAITDAVNSAKSTTQIKIKLDAPATPEKVLFAINDDL